MNRHTRRRSPLTILQLALLMLPAAYAQAYATNGSAPQDDWPGFRGNAQLTGVAATTLPGEPRVVWTFQAEAGIESQAAIANGKVYVGSLDGTLYCLSLDAGTLKWKYAAGAPIKSSPTIGGGTIYFGDEEGRFHAVDAGAGTRRWVFQTAAAIVSSPALSSGKVLFGSNDNHLYALSAKDGALVWKIATGGYVYGTPAIVTREGSPAAVSAGCDGFLRVVRVSDGEVLTKLELGSYVGASPAIDGNRAYFGTFDNQFLAVDLGAPAILWRYEHPERKFPYFSSAALDKGIVVVGGRDKMVHALNAVTGAAIWAYETRAKVDASPVLAGDRVVAANTAGDLFILDRATGREVWRFEAGSSFVGSPAVGSGRIIIGTTAGLLYAFGGER